MKIPRAPFFHRVNTGHFGMCAQIIPEGKMAVNLRRTCLEKMKLHDALPLFPVQGAITSSRYAMFAMPIVTQRFHRMTSLIKISYAGDQRHQIDDRLGDQVWHCR